MGKLLLSNQLHSTMKIRVMCDQSREHCGSKLINGGVESVPIVSMAKTFEDIDDLKSRICDQQEEEGKDSNHNGREQGMPLYPKENEENETDLSEKSKSSHTENEHENNQTIQTISSENCEVRPLNGVTNALNNLTVSSIDTVSDAQPHRVRDTESVKPGDKMLTITQDVPVEVGNSARFSKVLENISLPLLYIPTTKQLIAQKEASSDGSCQSQNCTESDKTKSRYFQEYNDNQRDIVDFNEICNSPDSGMQNSYSVSNTHDCVSPTAEFPDSRLLSAFNQDLFNPDYLQSCDTTSSSRLFADDTSLSSVSTGTDFSVSAFSAIDDLGTIENRSLSIAQLNEDSVFMDINLHSRNSFDRSQKVSSLENEQEGNQPATASGSKKGLSGFRNLFGKKVKEDSTPGWKFFGKVPPKVTESRNPQEISSEYQSKLKPLERLNIPVLSNRKQTSEVMSTTALILEKRPENLPTKSPEEEEKHRQEYIQMVEAAKKKEQRDLKLRKKKLQQQRKYEDKLMSFAKMWNNDILPNWESTRQTKKVRELWWIGLPPNVRGKVWMLAIGNDLNITHELFEICHKRAENIIKLMVEAENNVSTAQESTVSSSKEDSVNVIKLDVSRTFPQLGIIQKGGPYHDLLHSLLGAYACYRPDVGYVQGMSFIAAILLLNMEVADAFVCFANVLNRPCQVAFFRMDENLMAAYYKTFEAFFKENLPKLHSHFLTHNVTPNLYLMEWVFLLYGKSLPLDVACRVWDVFCRDGEEFLFRTAIAILKLYESVLLKMDFIHIAQFLTKLPEDIRGDDLFHELEGVRMSIDKRGFNAVHAFYKDLHESSS